MMQVQQVTSASAEYEQARALRQAVLREPLGLRLEERERGAEAEQLHFVMLDAQGIVQACVIAVPLSKDQAKLRQMAVSPELHGQGVGRTLLEAVEFRLAQRGVTELNMHARLSATGFYEKLGYRQVGESFSEVGIPHIRMEKILSRQDSDYADGGG